MLELVFEHILDAPVGTFARIGSGLSLAEATRETRGHGSHASIIQRLLGAMLDIIKTHLPDDDFAALAAELRQVLAAAEAPRPDDDFAARDGKGREFS